MLNETSEKCRVLVIFDHALALRSYLETKQIDQLGNVDSVITLFNLNQVQSNSLGLITIEDRSLKQFTKQLLSVNARLYWLCRTSKSLSFRRTIWKHNKFYLPSFIEKKVLRIIAFPISILLSLLVFVSEFNLYRRISHYARQGGRRVMYVSVGGTTSMNDFLCLVARKFKLELFVVLENWDNMSSKAVFNFVPFKIGVWGKQAQLFAQNIHDIPITRTRLVGNPRVEWLKQNIEVKKISKHFLFAGGSENFEDEIKYLLALANIAKMSPKHWEVKYLAHPKRYALVGEKFSMIENAGISVMNKEMIINSTLNGSNFVLPKMELYKSCFEGAVLVVSPLSTMNLESAILGIPTIGVNSVDRNVIGVHKPFVSRIHDHLIELEDKGMMKIVNSPRELEIALWPIIVGESDSNYLKVKEEDIRYLYSKKE